VDATHPLAGGAGCKNDHEQRYRQGSGSHR
jgi:hypothetical protein